MPFPPSQKSGFPFPGQTMDWIPVLSFEPHILKRIKQIKVYSGKGDQGSWGMGNYAEPRFLNTHMASWDPGYTQEKESFGLEKLGGYGVLSILCGLGLRERGGGR